MNEFAIVDLSSFYLDVLKDRMYTFAPTSQARRSAQTVLWQITEALVRLVAPILSFTADEVWEYLPAVEGREERASGAVSQAGRDLFAKIRLTVLDEWKKLFAIRTKCFSALEDSTQGKAASARVSKLTRDSRASGERWHCCSRIAGAS